MTYFYISSANYWGNEASISSYGNIDVHRVISVREKVKLKSCHIISIQHWMINFSCRYSKLALFSSFFLNH